MPDMIERYVRRLRPSAVLASVRTAVDDYALWLQQDDADRWLSYQDVSISRFQDTVHHEQAEGHGRRGA